MLLHREGEVGYEELRGRVTTKKTEGESDHTREIWSCPGSRLSIVVVATAASEPERGSHDGRTGRPMDDIYAMVSTISVVVPS